MITIDGSRGEGGGQILRTSLALSLITATPVRFVNIRAGRAKPGLLRQHLTGVRAAAAVGGAEVEGDALRSQEVTFRPGGRVRGGEYRFSVGSAGSAGLVLQTILPALLGADRPSEVVIEGGTHNMASPPFDFLDRAFLPLLRRAGGQVELTLERPGFYPAGGGRYRARITPSSLTPLSLVEAGALVEVRARAVVAQIPDGVGHRELRVLKEMLGLPRERLSLVREERSHGPGNVVTVEVESAQLTEVFTGFGQRGVAAERVADALAREVRSYRASGAPVGAHLADQLLIPMALAGGGVIRTQRPTLHTVTNIETISRFLDVPFAASELGDDLVEIRAG
jgi:RNA 3'-terminal phosphate cyclase (ATP)